MIPIFVKNIIEFYNENNIVDRQVEEHIKIGHKVPFPINIPINESFFSLERLYKFVKLSILLREDLKEKIHESLTSMKNKSRPLIDFMN